MGNDLISVIVPIYNVEAYLEKCIHSIIRQRECRMKDCVLAGEEALEVLIIDKEINNYAWNKLYRRRVFEHIRFPENK